MIFPLSLECFQWHARRKLRFKELPQGFRRDWGARMLVRQAVRCVKGMIEKITFMMFDVTFTICVFGYIGIRKVKGWSSS
jgi:hypothetical protein